MKKSAPGPRTQLRFESLRLNFVLMVFLAAVVWLMQDFVASFATREMMARTDLWTPDQWDDARVVRAFQKAKPAVRLEAKLETNANGFHPERHDSLTVVAPTKQEAIDGRQAMVAAIRAAYAEEWPGLLNSDREAPYADPVPNATSNALKRGCRGLALVLLFGALGGMLLKWRRSHLPAVALVGILATALTVGVLFLGPRGEGALWGVLLVVALPAGFLVLVSYVTRRVRRAATWSEGRARITRSEVTAERHRFSGESTTLKNVATVAYEFTAGSKTHHGDRISIGIAPADRVDQTLQRYPVGAEVPVFYDPENPADCVLERNPPVSLGCLWLGTSVALLLYAGAIVWLKSDVSLNALLEKGLPALHHPLIVIGAGSFGLFCLAAGVWNRLHPKTLAPWIRTPGTIVASATESYREASMPSNRSPSTYYKAVIEFRYEVDGKEYHSIKGASDLVKFSVANAKAGADAEVARYPVGMALDVYHNPANPTQASLDPNPGMTITGTSSLVVAAILIAVALYAATH